MENTREKMYRIQLGCPTTKISKENSKDEKQRRKNNRRNNLKEIPTTNGHKFSEWKDPITGPSKGPIKKRTILRYILLRNPKNKFLKIEGRKSNFQRNKNQISYQQYWVLKIEQCLQNSQRKLFLSYTSWFSKNINQVIFRYVEIQNIYLLYALYLQIPEDLLRQHMEIKWERGRHGPRGDQCLASSYSSLGQRKMSRKRRNFKDFILPSEKLKIGNGAIKVDDAKRNKSN